MNYSYLDNEHDVFILLRELINSENDIKKINIYK